MVRLSHSHIRIGSFQRFAALGQTDHIRALVDHCIAHYWPDAADAPDPIVAFYTHVIDAVARLGAEWFAAGFVHGVLNTDNINITGESFDYGPWRFLDRFDPAFTAAYFDHSGLYCFARQPEALYWNLARLGECLIPLTTQSAIQPAFDSFAARFQSHLARQTFARLCLLPPEDSAEAHTLTQAFWGAMQETTPPFQQVFHDLLGGGDAARRARSPIAEIYDRKPWADLRPGLEKLPPAPGLAAVLANPQALETGPETLVIDEVEAIWSAIDRDDDWAPLHAKVDRIRKIGRLNVALGLLRGSNARPGHLPLQDEIKTL